MTSDSPSQPTHATAGNSLFTCSWQVHERTALLSLCGEMDLASVERFEQAVNEALTTEPGHVVVDLSQLHFLDSSGMRALMRLQSRLGDQTRLELIPGPPAVQRVFELVGLTAVLPFRT